MDIRITGFDKFSHHPFNRNQRNVPVEFSGTAAADGGEWDWWALADREGGVVQQLDCRVSGGLGEEIEDAENDVRQAVEQLLTDLVNQIIDAENEAALTVLDKFVPRGSK